jgi:Glycosyl transferase family 2
MSTDSVPFLTIGMATYDDYDGVYFSVQSIRLHHPEVLDRIEFVIIDNNPDGKCGEALRHLANLIPNMRYVPWTGTVGSIVKCRIFEEARGEVVLSMDCHVLFKTHALKALIEHFEARPRSLDLVQGPMANDDLKSLLPFWEPVWRGGMWGVWAPAVPFADGLGSEAFDIPMQGAGVFACRKAAWPGFNPNFTGFGGEEGYIHEKFRQRGGRTLCLPSLVWLHRFGRPLGVPYPLDWMARVRNYMIGFSALGLPTEPIEAHFKEHLKEELEGVTACINAIKVELYWLSAKDRLLKQAVSTAAVPQVREA